MYSMEMPSRTFHGYVRSSTSYLLNMVDLCLQLYKSFTSSVYRWFVFNIGNRSSNQSQVPIAIYAKISLRKQSERWLKVHKSVSHLSDWRWCTHRELLRWAPYCFIFAFVEILVSIVRFIEVLHSCPLLWIYNVKSVYRICVISQKTWFFC